MNEKEREVIIDTTNIKFMVNYFYENKYTIHVTLYSGVWKNGLILKIEKDHFILDEFKEGETPILFSAIKDVSKYKFTKV